MIILKYSVNWILQAYFLKIRNDTSSELTEEGQEAEIFEKQKDNYCYRKIGVITKINMGR